MTAHSVQSSNSPPDLQKFNFQDFLKKRLHPPTHTACRPQCGLPLASPSLSARTSAKDWLAGASASRLVPTPAVTACLSYPPVCRTGTGRHADRSVGFSPFGSSATPFVCLVRKFTFQWGVPVFRKNIKKGIKKKKVIKRDF